MTIEFELINETFVRMQNREQSRIKPIIHLPVKTRKLLKQKFWCGVMSQIEATTFCVWYLN